MRLLQLLLVPLRLRWSHGFVTSAASIECLLCSGAAAVQELPALTMLVLLRVEIAHLRSGSLNVSRHR